MFAFRLRHAARAAAACTTAACAVLVAEREDNCDFEECDRLLGLGDAREEAVKIWHCTHGAREVLPVRHELGTGKTCDAITSGATVGAPACAQDATQEAMSYVDRSGDVCEHLGEMVLASTGDCRSTPPACNRCTSLPWSHAAPKFRRVGGGSTATGLALGGGTLYGASVTSV